MYMYIQLYNHVLKTVYVQCCIIVFLYDMRKVVHAHYVYIHVHDLYMYMYMYMYVQCILVYMTVHVHAYIQNVHVHTCMPVDCTLYMYTVFLRTVSSSQRGVVLQWSEQW